MDREYCIRGMELSRSKSDYYFYEYTKPGIIITSDHRIASAKEIMEPGKTNGTTVRGLRGEVKSYYSPDGEKRMEYMIAISKEVCPLRIRFVYARGEGYVDSDFWSSEYKEYWVTYL